MSSHDEFTAPLGAARAPEKRSTLALAAITGAGFAAYLGMNYPALWTVYRDYPDRGLVRTLFPLGYITVGYAALLILLRSLGRVGAAFVCMVVGVSVLANFIYGSIFKHSVLSSGVVEWLIAEHRQAPQAWREFMPEVLTAVAMTVFALAALFLAARTVERSSVRLRALGRRGPLVVVTLAFFAIHAVPLVRPVPFALSEANLYSFALLTLLESPPEPRASRTVPERAPLVEKVVLVVDESVTYTSYSEVVAPALAGLPALDYGAAASFSNCSAQSNALLRWGVERPSVGKPGYDPRSTPHLWGYARAAGFRTGLIDAQSGGFPQNLVSPGELKQLDEFVPASKGVDSDHLVAGLVNERLLRPGRDLIFVVKRGAHFPYAEACRPGVVSAQEPKSVQHLSAVRCSTEGFFEQLTRAVDLTRLLLVYTSDHGQNFETRSTHCNPQGSMEEYSVPMVVVTRASSVEELLRPGFSAMRGHASHSAIFPTLLCALGYERGWAESMYGASLAGPPAPFLTVGRERPYPFQRETTVRFSVGPEFPGRDARASGAAVPGGAARSRVARGRVDDP